MIFLGLLWSCLGGLASGGSTISENGFEYHPPVQPVLIRSSIDFNKGAKPIIRFGGVQTVDVLNSCPVENAPINIKDLLSLLVGKVKGSISRMEQQGGAHCEALQKRLNAANSKVAIALSNQLVTEVSQTQVQINLATQKASATNEFVLTVSELFQAQCLNSVNDRLIFQKSLAQLITLGGVFAGGWQGTVAATGGQFLGSLPFFPSDADKALAVFRRYEEKEERASFLCLYRQMQKTNCLLFTTPEENVIAGVDITGESGPYLTTKNSIEKFKRESPGVFADVVMLREMGRGTEMFFSIMEQPDAFARGPIEGYLALRTWCFDHPLGDFEVLGNFSRLVQENMTGIRSTCSAINHFEWRTVRSIELAQLLFESYWQLFFFRSFYETLAVRHSFQGSVLFPLEHASSEIEFGYIAETWESLKYFEGLKESLEKLRSTTIGNQFRMNYNDLVVGLGDTLAKKSFRSLMKENRSTGVKYSETQMRVLIAQLGLCQTLDPTLACLYVDRPSMNKLQVEWVKWCVGPKSSLCNSFTRLKEIDKKLINSLDREYFDSICGA